MSSGDSMSAWTAIALPPALLDPATTSFARSSFTL